MPVTPTYPGIYIEELPSAVRTITGVSTSITAFVGRALKGPVNEPKVIHSFADYDRFFGGLWRESNMSYAIYQYFQNGGRDAVIVRVHNNATESTIDIGGIFQIRAASPGKWSDKLKIKIEPVNEQGIPDIIKAEKDLPDPPQNQSTLFNLYVMEPISETEDVVLESFRI